MPSLTPAHHTTTHPRPPYHHPLHPITTDPTPPPPVLRHPPQQPPTAPPLIPPLVTFLIGNVRYFIPLGTKPTYLVDSKILGHCALFFFFLNAAISFVYFLRVTCNNIYF